MRAEDAAVAAWKAEVNRVLARPSSFTVDWSDAIHVAHYLGEMRESPRELLALFDLLPMGVELSSRLATMLRRDAPRAVSEEELLADATTLADAVSSALELPPRRGSVTVARTFSQDLLPLGSQDELLDLVHVLAGDPRVGPFVPLLVEPLYQLLGAEYASVYYVLSPWCAECEALRGSPAAALGSAFASWSQVAHTEHRLFSLGDQWFLLADETVNRHFRR
ncbi:MAG: hypothetical protein J0L92_15635 [Deltaproteobacteria bacterium]|nr:hypothetical protein [Deltaproteobacteria bacterium]